MNKAIEEAVLVEQINSMFEGFPALVFINICVGLFLVYGLWSVVPSLHLIIWMACMVAMLAARSILYRRHKTGVSKSTNKQKALFLVVGSGAAGLVWGIGGVALFPDADLTYQLFILFVLIGMGSGSSASLAMYLPAYYAFFPATILPISLKLFTMDGSIYTSLGAMALVYFFALSALNRNVSKSLKDALTLRHENIELVDLLKVQKNEAERANEAKSKFLAAASHDLRQPLHALSLFTQTLSESVESDKNRVLVNQISDSVDALDNLFNALLDISQFDAGVIKVHKTSFSLHNFFELLETEFKADAERKGLTLTFPETQLFVASDIVLLSQILRNYLSNAIRYTLSGSVAVDLKVEDGLVTICVIDTGQGITKNEAEQIYDEFYQLNNPEQNREKGLGLGLAIVKRSAKLLGHKIGVDSTPNEGSRFFIVIELASPVDEPKTQEIHQPQAAAIDYDLVILVIDDDSAALTGMQGLLDSWGCQVVAASGIEQAMASIEATNVAPDGIITDFRLARETTGLQAIRAVHNNLKTDVPALIVTGDIAVDRIKEMSESEFQVVFKPIRPLQLRAFLQQVKSAKFNKI